MRWLYNYFVLYFAFYSLKNLFSVFSYIPFPATLISIEGRLGLINLVMKGLKCILSIYCSLLREDLLTGDFSHNMKLVQVG